MKILEAHFIYVVHGNMINVKSIGFFLSQAGFTVERHTKKVIEALPIVLRDFPDVEVYVAGNDYTLRRTLKDKLKFRAYPNYICHLMDDLKVRDKNSFHWFFG